MKKILLFLAVTFLLVSAIPLKTSALTYTDDISYIQAAQGRTLSYTFVVSKQAQSSTSSVNLFNISFTSGYYIAFEFSSETSSLVVDYGGQTETILLTDYQNVFILIVSLSKNFQADENNREYSISYSLLTPSGSSFAYFYKGIDIQFFDIINVSVVEYETKYLMNIFRLQWNETQLNTYKNDMFRAINLYVTNITAITENFYNSGYNTGVNVGAGVDLNDYVLKDEVSGFIPPILDAVQAFLNISFGGVTLGAIFLIPFSISFVWFIVKQFRGGGE